MYTNENHIKYLETMLRKIDDKLDRNAREIKEKLGWLSFWIVLILLNASLMLIIIVS